MYHALEQIMPHLQDWVLEEWRHIRTHGIQVNQLLIYLVKAQGITEWLLRIR